VRARANARIKTKYNYRENPVSCVYIVPDGIRKIDSFTQIMNTCGIGGHVLLCQPTWKHTRQK
jgi:hypothetical protein